jgi:hypothetical protein
MRRVFSEIDTTAQASIAAILGDKTERIVGARRPHPMLVRKTRVIRTDSHGPHNLDC